MMRSFAFVASVLAASVVFEGPAAGQASVEYGLAAAAGGTAAGVAAARSANISAASTRLLEIFSRAFQAPETPSEKTVQLEVAKPLGRSQSKRATNQRTAGLSVAAVVPGASTPKASPPLPDQPRPKYEDPNQIQLGLEYEELVRRFGPPTLAFTEGQSSKLSYSSTAGTVEIEILGGKVTSTRKPRS